MTLEEVAARIQEALGEKTEHWLDLACDTIECYHRLIAREPIYDVSTVGKRIRVAREAAGMTMRQLAARLSVGHMAVYDWEHEREPIPYRKVIGLCISLRVSRAWLLMESDEGGPKVRGRLLRRGFTPESLATSRRWKKKWLAKQKAAELNAKRRSHEGNETG